MPKTANDKIKVDLAIENLAGETVLVIKNQVFTTFEYFAFLNLADDLRIKPISNGVRREDPEAYAQ